MFCPGILTTAEHPTLGLGLDRLGLSYSIGNTVDSVFPQYFDVHTCYQSLCDRWPAMGGRLALRKTSEARTRLGLLYNLALRP